MKIRKYVNDYTCEEIKKIVELYLSGMSLTLISDELNIVRKVIKKILILNNVWIENRNTLKIIFSDSDRDNVCNLYCNEKLSTRKIGNIYGISNVPIKRILAEKGVLRNSNSSGVKISLSDEEKETIKKLYLVEYKNVQEIGKVLNCSGSHISNYLSKNGLLRSRCEATKISVTGRKVSEKGIENMKHGQKNLVLSGKRKQSGGTCKTYVVNDLICKGTYEKSYIEYLLKNNIMLPKNCNIIITPYGGYYPDFKYSNKLIEVKSPYTYDVLLGIKKSRWTNQYETKQLKKIKWISENIIPVEIVIVDKNNIKEIKTI